MSCSIYVLHTYNIYELTCSIYVLHTYNIYELTCYIYVLHTLNIYELLYLCRTYLCLWAVRAPHQPTTSLWPESTQTNTWLLLWAFLSSQTYSAIHKQSHKNNESKHNWLLHILEERKSWKSSDDNVMHSSMFRGIVCMNRWLSTRTEHHELILFYVYIDQCFTFIS